jgi:hypothetical protein
MAFIYRLNPAAKTNSPQNSRNFTGQLVADGCCLARFLAIGKE